MLCSGGRLVLGYREREPHPDVDLNAMPAPGGPGLARGVQVPIGKGSIDWVKTFATAKAGGVKNYFVEQTMELTRESIAALKAMKA